MMAFSSNYDLYESMRKLISDLYDEGAEELAGCLSDAMSISSIAGEVLGEIRLALLKIRQHLLYKRVDIRTGVDEGIEYVDNVLGKYR